MFIYLRYYLLLYLFQDSSRVTFLWKILIMSYSVPHPVHQSFGYKDMQLPLASQTEEAQFIDTFSKLKSRALPRWSASWHRYSACPTATPTVKGPSRWFARCTQSSESPCMLTRSSPTCNLQDKLRCKLSSGRCNARDATTGKACHSRVQQRTCVNEWYHTTRSIHVQINDILV